MYHYSQRLSAKRGKYVNSREQQVGMELYVHDNKELFHKIAAKKDEIENRLGMKLDWQELPERKASRVFIAHEGDFADENQAPELVQWLAEAADNFAKVFPKYI